MSGYSSIALRIEDRIHPFRVWLSGNRPKGIIIFQTPLSLGGYLLFVDRTLPGLLSKTVSYRLPRKNLDLCNIIFYYLSLFSGESLSSLRLSRPISRERRTSPLARDGSSISFSNVSW